MKTRKNNRDAAKNHPLHVSQQFSQLAHATSIWTGQPVAFLLAVAVVIVWAATGPIFNYSDTWQLVINTGTTIVTFLMVFLIQNTQNRDTLAIQLKLSELVLAMKGAENKFAAIEALQLANNRLDCRARDHGDSVHRKLFRCGRVHCYLSDPYFLLMGLTLCSTV